MSYSPEQIAAFVGAAAWLPQLFRWGYGYFSRPKVVLIPNSTVEIGYTAFGPIFNIKLALSGALRDVLLEEFTVEIKHENGETRTLHWRGTQEVLNQIRDASGIRETVEREGSAIAVKVTPDMLVDRVFRMQDTRFQEQYRTLLEDLSSQVSFQKSQGDGARARVEASDVLDKCIRYYRANFSWRPGRYQARFHCKSINEPIRLETSDCNFLLSQADVDVIRENTNLLRDHFLWVHFRNETIPPQPEIQFAWIYPQISR